MLKRFITHVPHTYSETQSSTRRHFYQVLLDKNMTITINFFFHFDENGQIPGHIVFRDANSFWGNVTGWNYPGNT